MCPTSDNIGLMWGSPHPKQTFQKFAEEGVEYFKRKYGYMPTRIEYRIEDGVIDIPGIVCKAKSTGHQRHTIMLFPAIEHDR
jgi:hypothetical protein